MKEVWKDIMGFEGIYMVSNKHRIKSMPKSNHPTERIIKLCNRAGYLGIAAHRNGVVKTVYLHRALAQAFIPNPKNKPQINHKDGNKLNNSLNNLEWCTQEENIRHAYRTGLMNGIHQRKRVTKCSDDGIELETYTSVKEACDNNNINHRSSITQAIKNDNRAGDFKWKYA